MKEYIRLYRSTSRPMIGGVAAGLAEYFRIDPLIVRVLFVAGLFLGGATLLAYLVMWGLVPRDPEGIPGRSGFLGVALKAMAIMACIGVVAASFESDFWVGGFAVGLLVGLYFYWRSRHADDEPLYDRDAEPRSRTRFFRSTSDRKILGVFGGVAETMNVDPTILRIVGVVLLVVGFPVTIALYLLAALLMPKSYVVIRLE